MEVEKIWFSASVKYIERHGMNKYLNALLISELHQVVLPQIKEKYPNEATKIKLWQKLHGV